VSADDCVKILILKPSSLGDVVQALPVLRLLKQHAPAAEIYWWIDSNLAPLLEGDPDLSGVFRFERRRWASPLRWGELLASIRTLRAQQFDWVIDLQCLARSGAVAWLANGELTVGLDEPREGARGFYDLIARRRSFHTHAVDWYLAVLPLLQVPLHTRFEWLPPRPAVAESIRRKWPLISQARWLIVQPGARWASKRWPPEYFAELVRRLARAHPHHRFAILGSTDDQPLGELIVQATPERCLDLTGKLSLTEMVEWIRLAELMVSNDTGPMHVAAALGKPVVALFGPTEPRRTGPYGQIEHVLQTDLPCQPCFSAQCHYIQPLECLRAIGPHTVLKAVAERLPR
jgi:lipopolysaccharide heptosyltransferase II